MTIREQLQISDEIRKKNDAAFAEAARLQKAKRERQLEAAKEVGAAWLETFACIAFGALCGFIVTLIAG